METIYFYFPKVAGLDYLELLAFMERVEKIIRLEAPKMEIKWDGGSRAIINCQPEEVAAIQNTLYMFYRVKPSRPIIF